jgi:hypothetical protein
VRLRITEGLQVDLLSRCKELFMGKTYSHWFDKQGKHLKKQKQKQIQQSQTQRKLEKESNMPIVTARISPGASNSNVIGTPRGVPSYPPAKPLEPIRSYSTPPAAKNNNNNKNNPNWWQDDNAAQAYTGFVGQAKAIKTNPAFKVGEIAFSGWAKEDVKYFSGGVLISLTECIVGLPISMPGVDFLKEFDLTPMEQMKILWGDFGPPPLPPELVYKLYQFLLRRDKNVHVHCAHGNGRTGTLLACFAICAGLPQAAKKAPLDWIREHYCSAAVESLSQREYLIDFELWFEKNSPK